MCFLFVYLSLSLCLSFICNNFKTDKLCELLKGMEAKSPSTIFKLIFVPSVATFTSVHLFSIQQIDMTDNGGQHLSLSFMCNNFKTTEKPCELLNGMEDMADNGSNVGDFGAFVHCGAFDEPLDKGVKKSSKHILFYHKMAEKGIQINFCQLSLSFCSRAHFYHLDIEECPNHFW